jgi:hypothetical protein
MGRVVFKKSGKSFIEKVKMNEDVINKINNHSKYIYKNRGVQLCAKK